MNVIRLHYIAPVLILAMVCGCRGRQTGELPIELSKKVTSTGGIDEDGREFTGFSPVLDIQNIKSQLEDNEDNRSFADNVESASLVKTKSNQLQIMIKWRDLPNPLIFRGKLYENDGKYLSRLHESTGQKQEFIIHASCSQNPCSQVTAILIDNQRHKIGLIVKEEVRPARLRIPGSQKPTIEKLDDEKKAAIQELEKTKTVTVSSSEVYPGGKTSVIVKNDSGLEVSGNVVRTNGECVPMKSNEKAKKVGDSTCLKGNNEQGQIIIEFQNGEGPHAYLEVTKPDQQKPNRQVSPQCDFQIDTKKLDPITASILPDCERPMVKITMQDWWEVDTRGRGGLIDFMKLYQAVENGNPIGTAQDLKKMLEVFAAYRLPLIFSYFPLIETNFNKELVGGAKEVGVFQFTDDAARRWGLTELFSPIWIGKNKWGKNLYGPDERDIRIQIAPASKAFSKMMKYNLSLFNNDFKMAAAAYNCGDGCGRKAKEHLNDEVKKQENSKTLSPMIAELKEASELYQFWYMEEFGFIPDSTQIYVERILSAIFVSLKPEFHNIKNVPAISLY